MFYGVGVHERWERISWVSWVVSIVIGRKVTDEVSSVVPKDWVFRRYAAVLESEGIEEVNDVLVHGDVGEVVGCEHLQRLEVQKAACAGAI